MPSFSASPPRLSSARRATTNPPWSCATFHSHSPAFIGCASATGSTPVNLSGTSMTAGRAGRRTSSCSSATACRSPSAMGVYADRTLDPLDDPKVETISSLVKRRHRMAVGIVTNTEIEDATPAAMVAHVRRRSEYDRIVEQFFAAKPDLIMGGGRANFLPKSVEGGKRRDDSDFVAQFRDAGYGVASTGPEMTSLADDAKTTKLLGLFTLGNMDGALDRKILKGGTVRKFPEQPDLTEQVSAALKVLAR